MVVGVLHGATTRAKYALAFASGGKGLVKLVPSGDVVRATEQYDSIARRSLYEACLAFQATMPLAGFTLLFGSQSTGRWTLEQMKVHPHDPASIPPPELSDPRRVDWPSFYALLLAPAVIGSTTMSFPELAIPLTLIAVGAAGIGCARMTAPVVDHHGVKKRKSYFFRACGFGLLSLCLGYAGCCCGAAGISMLTR